ncbi:hypothetical protein HKX48_003176, partial [Thoreauomyces humboldtii]
MADNDNMEVSGDSSQQEREETSDKQEKSDDAEEEGDETQQKQDETSEDETSEDEGTDWYASGDESEDMDCLHQLVGEYSFVNGAFELLGAQHMQESVREIIRRVNLRNDQLVLDSASVRAVAILILYAYIELEQPNNDVDLAVKWLCSRPRIPAPDAPSTPSPKPQQTSYPTPSPGPAARESPLEGLEEFFADPPERNDVSLGESEVALNEAIAQVPADVPADEMDVAESEVADEMEVADNESEVAEDESEVADEDDVVRYNLRNRQPRAAPNEPEQPAQRQVRRRAGRRVANSDRVDALKTAIEALPS